MTEQNREKKNSQPEMFFDKEDPSLLMRPELRQGSRPGDMRVRIVLPHQHAFRRLHYGVLEATEETEEPHSAWGWLKRIFIGPPLPTARAATERLTKVKALAVLSSDAISSVAYATEAMLASLIAAGSGHLWVMLPISCIIVGLLCVVALSYRQTIPAYPSGGGSYIVARENLGTVPGLVAAASLMIDYVLTVAVSVSAGVLSLATLFPILSSAFDIVSIDVTLIILITIINLRGIRQSGSIFAAPTYLFIGSALLMIVVGVVKSFVIEQRPLIGPFPYVAAVEPLSLFLILKSFSAGCSAMTGVEAISNGIPAFKKPETRNASITLTWMAIILGGLFLGITALTMAYRIEVSPTGNPTVIGQIAQRVFNGPLFFFYPIFQIATLLILALAANTSYSDFPRLASLLARDLFLPHQFAFRGDRLAFSTGIVFLATVASLLLMVFEGDTTSLINLYAVGVFISFTLSQSGMVRHWWVRRHSDRHWLHHMLMNGLGASVTLLVALVISVTKFLAGAWIVVVCIPLFVWLFLSIRQHYLRVQRERTTEIPLRPKTLSHRFIVPVMALDAISQYCVSYARSITPQVTAVHVAFDRKRAAALSECWNTWQSSLSEDERVPLSLVEPACHSFSRCLLAYLEQLQAQYPNDTLTVVLHESDALSFRERLHHHLDILAVKGALYSSPDIVVTDIMPPQQCEPVRPEQFSHRFIVPVTGLDRSTLQCLAYARSICSPVTAVHVGVEEQDIEEIRDSWLQLQRYLSQEEETRLVVIESPYRSLVRPLLAYVDTLRELYPTDTFTVILPKFVVEHWWEYPLHNQTAFRIKKALQTRPGIVVTTIPRFVPRD
uniref:Amino acid permease n=1 Tax=Thermosporothrix sp. COM3 TaxID=2490863 RepID=A0A455SH89_9CHLR|nr:hypothetical protein KTC_25840 [Thermosporothrix sp. COM3]